MTFNEAGAVKPRKRKGSGISLAKARAFNEAGAVKPRKRGLRAIGSLHVPAPFNEAGAVKPRKLQAARRAAVVSRPPSMRPGR